MKAAVLEALEKVTIIEKPKPAINPKEVLVKVVAPYLSGHGNDKRPISEISFNDYIDKVCQVLDILADPVMLVGHSMGGRGCHHASCRISAGED